MTRKLIKINPTKAYSVEAIQIGEDQMISIRQMYATKKDPKLKPGYQGLTIPLEHAARLGSIIRKMAVNEDVEFTVLEPKERKKKE